MLRVYNISLGLDLSTVDNDNDVTSFKCVTAEIKNYMIPNRHYNYYGDS